MKTTAIEFFKRPVALRALLWACTASVLLISSCGERGKDSSDDTAAKTGEAEDVRETTQSEFPPQLDFYDNLFERSNCEASFKDSEVTGPLTCTQFKDAVIAFGRRYDSGSGQTLNYEPTKLPFAAQNAELIIELLADYADQTDYGLVFHYGHRVQSGRGEIVYILSKGQLVKDPPTARVGDVRYTPFESGENGQNQAHYIALEVNNGMSYRVIDQAEFEALTDSYFDNIEYEGNAIDVDHARMAYHAADSLNIFYGEYAAENDLHLYLGHGAVEDDGSADVLHTPCLAFGDGTEFFELDNVGYNATFRKKGLDIGRLCPPHCSPPAAAGGAPGGQ